MKKQFLKRVAIILFSALSIYLLFVSCADNQNKIVLKGGKLEGDPTSPDGATIIGEHVLEFRPGKGTKLIIDEKKGTFIFRKDNAPEVGITVALCHCSGVPGTGNCREQLVLDGLVLRKVCASDAQNPCNGYCTRSLTIEGNIDLVIQ